MPAPEHLVLSQILVRMVLATRLGEAAMAISSSKPDYVPPTDAIPLRELLHRTRLSQANAARILEINEVRLRSYCAGTAVPPRYVLLALERLVDLERQPGTDGAHAIKAYKANVGGSIPSAPITTSCALIFRHNFSAVRLPHAAT
jgi:hypothetical protein